MNGVVTLPSGQPVVGCRATHHHVFNAAITDGAVGQAGEESCFVPGGQRIIEDGASGAYPARFEVEGRRGKNISGKVSCRGVAGDDVAEGLFLQLGEHIQARRAGEVIETVVILQPQHLRAEHVGKAGSQHAAERLQFLRQAAEPEVHIFQASEGTTGIDPGCIKEVLGIQVASRGSADQGCRSGAPGSVCRGGPDGGMGAVGGDEIGEGFRVLDVQSEIAPAGIRGER